MMQQQQPGVYVQKELELDYKQLNKMFSQPMTRENIDLISC